MNEKIEKFNEMIEYAANRHAKHPIQDNHATAIYFAEIGYGWAVEQIVKELNSCGLDGTARFVENKFFSQNHRLSSMSWGEWLDLHR
jgi:2-iminoacetate synthase ThiH